MSGIDFDSDVWKLTYGNTTVGKNQNWQFGHIKSPTLKEQAKRYFRDGLGQKFAKQDSLYRYCYGLKHFTKFLDEFELELNYCEELTYQYVMQFIWYLNQNLKSSGSRTGTYSSLKSVVTYGQLMGLEKYPKTDIFPQNPCKLLHAEDELVSKEIPLEVMEQIVEALKVEQDVVLKTMIEVAKETGIRLSELLNLKLDSIVPDFMDNPYLYVYSIKQDKDRVIPVRKRLVNAVQECIEYAKTFRGSSTLLFLLETGEPIQQWKAREMLFDFIGRHGIADPNDELEFAHVTWHQFRHSLGTDALSSGMHPIEVQELLGHDSLHSTSLYAKVRDIALRQEYKKVGFIGVVTKDPSRLTEKAHSAEELKLGSLPDGICRKAFEGDDSCKNFNKCLLCPKFITSPEYLEIHKQHLERIRKDRTKYMDEMYICNFEKVERIEIALESIIEQLEAMA
ncbi:MAG: hypothetical protein APF81_14075 [Desulfosporosinus sp. BRH_c37]|nr:MAG: hypothetical protein APF81_14075 [Desulfosporosinus sp. BRH_c37]